jgi:hypothetical protein
MNAHAPASRYRFSIADLLKYVSVCAVLMAVAPLTGVAAAVLLAAFALALVAGQGLLAVLLFLAALFASQALATDRSVTLTWTIVIGSLVIAGYRLQRRWQDAI